MQSISTLPISSFSIVSILLIIVYWCWIQTDQGKFSLIVIAGFTALLIIDRFSAGILCLQIAFVTLAIKLLCSPRRMSHVFAHLGAIGATIGPLVYFKYFKVPDTNTISPMPFGLSYFSLIMLGLFLDFARRRETLPTPTTPLIRFVLFLPLIPLGPIERWNHLGPQLAKPKKWSTLRSAEGLQLIGLGLFKKFVVADRIGKPYSEFQDIALALAGPQLWSYMLLAFIQMFCDFSAMTDLFRGFSKLLGIDLVENFNQPYFAKSIPDIWRRWHISLVDWLRDFVYAPIALRTQNLYLATLVVMLLVGFWHSLTWNYFAWASYWSALSFSAIYIRQRGMRIPLPSSAKTLLNFVLMSASTIIFVPKNWHEVSTLLANFGQFAPPTRPLYQAIRVARFDLLFTIIGFTIVVGIETMNRRAPLRDALGGDLSAARFNKNLTPIFLLCASALLLLLLTMAFAVDHSNTFIYTRY